MGVVPVKSTSGRSTLSAIEVQRIRVQGHGRIGFALLEWPTRCGYDHRSRAIAGVARPGEAVTAQSYRLVTAVAGRWQ